MAKIGSIIIPAHNEAAVIRRFLDALFDGLDPQEVETILVCNGCADATADIARASGYDIRILELPQADKSAALRAGDNAATTFPRVYVDADVEVSGRAMRRVLAAASEGVTAARPPVRFETSHGTWPVRRFYEAKSRLPSLNDDLCAAGIYAFSQEARSRFDEFPQIIADDLFAARVVDHDEVTIVDTEPLTIHTPRDSRMLLKIMQRSIRGNAQFAMLYPALMRATTSRTAHDLLRLATRPKHLIDVVIYVLFAVGARLAVKLRKPTTDWERDESSRVPT